MGKTIIAVSGAVAAGKTSLARQLEARYGAQIFRTVRMLQARAEAEGLGLLNDRKALQHYGEELDRRTAYTWVAQDLAPRVAELPDRSVIVIDAIRVRDQLTSLQRTFGRRITHVHLTADLAHLAARYRDRGRASGLSEPASYDLVRADPTEAAIEDLADCADVLIDTAANDPADVLVRCAARVGLLPQLNRPLVDVVIGAQYGSEGKGNVCYYLAPEYDVLVRVGGANAGHQVPTDPVFTHRLLPSGTMSNEAAHLVLGPGAVLDVDVLLHEVSACHVEADRLTIDPRAMVVEQSDKDAEESLRAIASTRQGVGHATARRILGRGEYPGGSVRLAGDVPELRPFTSRPASVVLEDAYSRGQRILLEGTQGTGLSLFHGDYPHVTSRDTTASGCLAEAGISPGRVRRVVLVARTFPIRVGGTSGPMGHELTLDAVADGAGLPPEDLAQREVGSVSGTPRRIAAMGWARLRQAAELNGATDIALTFADYIDSANRSARRFDQLTSRTIGLIDEVEQVTGCRVSLVSTDFAARGLLDRRAWRGHLVEPMALDEADGA